jgi:NADPH:quinone reductase-like Zn-dependent oxidoreductase
MSQLILTAIGGDLAETVRLGEGPDPAVGPDDVLVAQALGDSRLRLILDGVGGSKAGDLVGALESGGTVVAYSSQTGEPPVLPVGDLIYRDISLRSFFIINWIREAPRAEIEQTYAELAHLVAEGVLHAAVETTYPLSQYRVAPARAQDPHRAGKVLFSLGSADR